MDAAESAAAQWFTRLEEAVVVSVGWLFAHRSVRDTMLMIVFL